MILSVLWAVFGDSERVVLVAQSLCDGITSLVVFHLFRSRFDTAVGLLAQTWFAVYPPFIAYATTLQTETWFQLCVVSGFALVLSTRNPRAGRVFAAGLLLGVAALIRPIGLLVLLVLIAGVLTTKDRVRVPTLLRVVMLTSAGVFMPILPWSTSNVARTGGFSLITPASWFSIWLTTTEGAHRAMWDPHSAGPVLTRLYGEEIPALSENVRALTPRERQAFWRSKAMASFRENPGTALRYRARALIHTWKFWLTPGFYSTRAVFASILVFGPVVLLGFVGIARLAATRAGPDPTHRLCRAVCRRHDSESHWATGSEVPDSDRGSLLDRTRIQLDPQYGPVTGSNLRTDHARSWGRLLSDQSRSALSSSGDEDSTTLE